MTKNKKAMEDRPPEAGMPEVADFQIPTHVWLTPTNPAPGQADQYLAIETAYKLVTKKKTWKAKTENDQDAIDGYRATAEAKGAEVQETYTGCC